MGAAVQINAISHRFSRQGPLVLDDLNLDIGAGERVALIGESGCGKSTLLHMLAGLSLPSDGCIRVNGRQVTRPHSDWNMMFQRPALYPWLSVTQNVALGLQFTGQSKGLKERVDEMLALVGLGNRGNDRIQDLSGGQQQRVALARSLAVKPKLILLDEPFSALDPFTRRSLQLEVSRIAHDQKITLVLVTHDIDEAITMGDRIVVMGRNPGTFRAVLDNRLPSPRNPMHPDFVALRRSVMQHFEASMEVSSETDAAADPAAMPYLAQGESAHV
ncbi:ABC transporter ATP-binding protein [uncultured Marinobacter sp.]|uniref:ABC transporter ATP-binding protein n=1 Tax=uncultured Marinobacter sp. TaxID=187379 RepID=UPI0030DABCB8